MECVENRVSLATTEAIPLVTQGTTKHALLSYHSKKENRVFTTNFPPWMLKGSQGGCFPWCRACCRLPQGCRCGLRLTVRGLREHWEVSVTGMCLTLMANRCLRHSALYKLEIGRRKCQKEGRTARTTLLTLLCFGDVLYLCLWRILMPIAQACY